KTAGYVFTTYCLNKLEWLWVMTNEWVAFYLIYPRRSKEAFTALIDDWTGLLVSDGYGVYQSWVETWQTCLAHLIRTARGLAARGRWPSCNGCVRWRRRLRLEAHGGPGMLACANGLISIMSARMRRGALQPGCCGRWTHCGCFCSTTASSRPTIERN